VRAFSTSPRTRRATIFDAATVGSTSRCRGGYLMPDGDVVEFRFNA
jgi:hypothetical protein